MPEPRWSQHTHGSQGSVHSAAYRILPLILDPSLRKVYKTPGIKPQKMTSRKCPLKHSFNWLMKAML